MTFLSTAPFFRISHFLFLLISSVAGLASHTACAQVSAPTNGGGVSVTRITATSMELTFGTNGTGQGRVVALAATQGGRPVPLTAANGTYYEAATTYGQGATLGQGYAVYNGPNHTVTVTGLQPSTYYYITNAEYNTDGNAIMYNTRGTSVAVATRSAVVSTSPLPVELTSFTGSIDAHNLATLHWNTASERNTAYFALERSTDSKSFSELTRVVAAGNSTQTLGYQWTDSQTLAQATYYRLRQVDNDGTATYSRVVVVAPIAIVNHLVEVYPNPSVGKEINLSLQGFENDYITLNLHDALGRQILMRSFTSTDASSLMPLALPQGLVPGTYILSIASKNYSSQKRIIVSDN